MSDWNEALARASQAHAARGTTTPEGMRTIHRVTDAEAEPTQALRDLMTPKPEPTPLQASAVRFVAALAQNIDAQKGIATVNGTRETQARVAAEVKRRFFEGEAHAAPKPLPPTSEAAKIVDRRARDLRGESAPFTGPVD